MNSTKGAIHFEATMTNDDMKRKLAEIRQGLLDSGRTADAEGAKIEGMFRRAAVAAGAFFTAGQAIGFIKQIAVVRGEFQQLEVAFETMLGSKQKANTLMAQMVDTAAKTPFNLQSVAGGAKQLLAYGSAAEDINKELVMLGNISAGLSIPLGDMVYLYGTTQTQGRVFAYDMRQFMGRGIPLAAELAKQFGVTTDQISEMVSAGKIGFPEVQKALQAMTGEGGKFHNLLEKNSKTITGQISNLGDAWDSMLNDMGKSSDGIITGAISSASYLVKHYETILRILGTLIATYGSYKAALIAVSVTQKAIATSGNIGAWFSLAKGIKTSSDAMTALNLAMGANPILKIVSLLIAAGTALYLFASNSDDAEKELTGLAKATKSAGEEFDKERSKIEALQSVMNNSKAAYDERKKALNELKTLIPQYNGELNKEGQIINSNTDAIKLYLKQLEKQIKMKAAQEELEVAYRQKRQQEKEIAKKQAHYDKASQRSSQATTTIAYGDGGADYQLHSLNAATSAQNALDKAKNNLDKTNKSIEELNEEIATTSTGGATATVKTFSEQLADAAGNVSKYKKELSDLQAGKGDGVADFAKAIQDKEKELKEAQSKYDLLAGIDRKAAGKTIAQAANANQARIEAERELKERLVEIQFQTEQAVIDAQAEGYDRQMAQIKLNYNKKLVAIELWEREQRKIIENAQKTAYIAGGGDEQKFKFDPADPAAANALTTISSSATAQRDTALKGNVNEQTELLKKLKTQWQSWGDDYQQIEDKITKTQADAAKARKEINARYKAGDINLGEAGIALGAVDTGEAAQITDLNSQKTKLTASWSSMFRDLRGMSRGEVDKLIEAINEELKNKKLSAADASALFEQLGKAKEYSIGLNPFAAWVDSLGDVKTATEAVEVARQKVNQIKSTDSEKDKADAEKALQDAQKLLADSKERRAASASQSLSDISNIAGATSDLLKTFGVESPAVDGVVGALSSLASIDFTNAISVVTGGLQAIASLIGGIFGEMDSVKEAEIQRLQGKVDALEKSYEKLGKAIDKAYSADASAMIGQQNEMLEKQKQLIRLQIEQEQAKKDSDGGKIKQWQEQLDALDEKIEENNEAKIDAIFGSDIKSAIADFASAYMDSWAPGEDRAKSQKDVVKKMIQGIVTEIIKSNIADKVVALREALKNAIIDGVISETEQAAIDKLQDEIYAQSEADAKNYEKWLKDDDALQNENSLTGQIRGTVATEASVAELGGIFRGQYDKLANMDSNIGSGIGHLMDIARTNMLIEINTRRTADNTDGLRETLTSTNVRLDQVIKNTSKDNGSYGS